MEIKMSIYGDFMTVTFKSTPENYVKEYFGIKSNTVRVVDDKDERFKLLREWAKAPMEELHFIEITLSGVAPFKIPENFYRSIKDITFWKAKDTEVCIISW